MNDSSVGNPLLAQMRESGLSDVDIARADAMLGLLAWFALGDLRGWWAARQVAAAKDRAIEVGVDGMTCGGCSSRLQKVLSRIDGVEKATAAEETTAYLD